MKTSTVSYALSIGAVALLTSCGGSQPPIGAASAAPPQHGTQVERRPDDGAEFVYTPDYESAEVSAFRIDDDGELTRVKGSPFPAGDGPISIAIDPNGRFLYVTNQMGPTSSISGYTIDPTDGALTPIKGSPFQSGFASFAIAIGSSGKFAYVADYGTGSSGYVEAYAINSSTGALEQLKSSPYSAGYYVNDMVMDPSGKFVYVGCNGGNISYGNLYAYAINEQNGALTPVKGSPFFAGGASDGIAVSASGKRLYSVTGSFYGSLIFGFDINPSSGVLTRVRRYPHQSNTISNGIAIAPNDTFAYVTDYYEGELSAYKIAPDGRLLNLKGSPFEVGKSTLPYAVTVDPSGRFLYTADHGHSRIAAFQIGPNGAPAELKGSPFKADGIGPTAIVTCRVTSGKCVP